MLIIFPKIKYIIQKADIILFPIFLLDKPKIVIIIDNLYYLIDCFGIANIKKNKKVYIKVSHTTIRYIIYIISKKYNKRNLLYKFF